jgi:hypothetical protein
MARNGSRRRREGKKKRIVLAFKVFVVVHTIIFTLWFGEVFRTLGAADAMWFLPFDLPSIVMAVIILDLIIGISGCAAAGSDVIILWISFQLVVAILLIIEVGTFWLFADVEGLTNIARDTWAATDAEGIPALESAWGCCGFDNTTDRPDTIGNCSYAECCREKLGKSMELVRDAASIVNFVDFILVMFMDFAGCAICFHPTVDPRPVRDRESDLGVAPLPEDTPRVP